MVENKTWDEFRSTGLLWYINTILHVFGWAIVLRVDEQTDEVVGAAPSRVKYRGFSEKIASDNNIKISEYLKNNINDLCKEAKEEE